MGASILNLIANPGALDVPQERATLANTQAATRHTDVATALAGKQIEQAALDNKMRQRALQDQDIQRRAYVNSDGSPTGIRDYMLKNGISAGALMEWQKHDLQMKKDSAALTKEQREAEKMAHGRVGEILSSLKMTDPAARPAAAQAAIQELQTLEPGHQWTPAMLTDDNALAATLGAHGAAGAYLDLAGKKTSQEHTQTLTDNANAEEQQRQVMRPLLEKKATLENKELQHKVDLLANQTPEAVLALVDQVVPPGVKENAALNARTKALVQAAVTRGDMAAAQDAIKTAGAEMRQLEVATDPRVQQNKINLTIARNDAQTAGASDDDFVRSGEQYARTGVMPPLGMSSAGRTKILHYGNEWARANHLSPSDLITMQAAYKGDIKSLENFQKQRDQIVSFEQTAQKNLDLFLTAADKIPDTGVPWLNTPLRLLDEKLVGSANMAAVNAARQVANNEIAKVTSGGGLGGVLSDSARKEVAEYNPRNATLGQTIAVAKLLKQDMANRHQSMDATLGDIKSRIGGGGSPQPPNPPQGPKATHRFNPTTGKIEVIP